MLKKVLQGLRMASLFPTDPDISPPIGGGFNFGQQVTTPPFVAPNKGVPQGIPMTATDIGGGPVGPPPQPNTPILQDIGGEPVFDESVPKGPSPYDSIKRMGELYQPSTMAGDRLDNLLANMPQYEKPGFWRTAAAALSAFGPGGHDIGMKVANFQNERKMADWQRQVIPAQKAAELERNENVNARTTAYQQVQQELTALRDEAKAKNDAEKTRIAEGRLSVMEYKAKNPNVKIIQPKGGYVTAVDHTGKGILVTGPDGKPIPSGTLSRTDEMNLNQQHEMKQIEAKTAGQIEVEQERQTGREGLAETRGWIIGSIPDPNDPTKQIGVQMNQITGEVKPILMGGQQTGPFVKPGTKLPNFDTSKEMEAIRSKTQETLAALGKILNDKDQLTPTAQTVVGGSRVIPWHWVPGSEERSTDNDINRFKALQLVDLIGQMKAQSRTGATGFGQLNLRELGLLEAAASALDPYGNEEHFRNELAEIKKKLKKILQPATGSGVTAAPAPPGTLNADDMLKKYGG